MELAEIILSLVGGISLISAWVIKSVIQDVKELEHHMSHCQSNMPKEYVMKSDYKDDIKEIKSMLGDLFSLVREGENKK